MLHGSESMQGKDGTDRKNDDCITVHPGFDSVCLN